MKSFHMGFTYAPSINIETQHEVLSINFEVQHSLNSI